jgi:hypothetical protein
MGIIAADEEYALYAELNRGLAALRRGGFGDVDLAANIARGLRPRVEKDGAPHRPDVSAIARLKKEIANR